jgi:serine/threonine-protein phosphatase 6 regulatory ankyrin repeat subunit B
MSMLGRPMLERKTVEAILDGKTEEIRTLLQQKTPQGRLDLLAHRDGEGQTPLMLATENGDVNMVRLLLQHGASPNDVNNFDQTAVHYACFEGQPAILQLLLQNGGNVNVQDDMGQTPLHEAAEASSSSPDDDEERYHQDDEVPMQLYKILLQYGARVNVKNDDGDTPLHCKW